MRVRMMSSQLSSPDGIQVIHYLTGKSYEVPDKLGQVWVLQGVAEQDKDMEHPPETKDDFEWPWGGKEKDAIAPDEKSRRKKRRK